MGLADANNLKFNNWHQLRMGLADANTNDFLYEKFMPRHIPNLHPIQKLVSLHISNNPGYYFNHLELKFLTEH